MLVRTDRTQLLLVANEDVFGSIDFFYGLAHIVAATQRFDCGAIGNQHVAGRFAVALLQNLGTFDCRGILLGVRLGALTRSAVNGALRTGLPIRLTLRSTLPAGRILVLLCLPSLGRIIRRGLAL